MKFPTPQDLQDACDAYFKNCDAKEKPYTITGLALWLGTDRDTLLDYKNGKHGDEYSYSYKEALMKCHNFAEERLYGDKQVAGVIFNLKNNYGWKDKQEVENSGESSITVKWQD